MGEGFRRRDGMESEIEETRCGKEVRRGGRRQAER
jgi:hypothetical protein